ncbi:hypothetical protein GCM10010193_51600 [Kitasatospora atroaurantiaca]|uniref:Quinol monooxygenase YgiN n=1 Tax=Kitasatospora atroaurantiaca TaxID=285545 RepID=A0A561EXX4_9ACTN|nr:putative quinol monooxygenase [Kitasatospora atroaurantiaca]TWE20465.1 quinol monooxygenase YgiN [Kitasatospora atroaurantiaca]
MPLTVVARFEAGPGQEDRLRTELEAMIEPSVDEPGCLAYELYVDPNRPGRMAVVEEWTCRPAFERHAAGAYRRRVADLLAGPVTVQYLTES